MQPSPSHTVAPIESLETRRMLSVTFDDAEGVIRVIATDKQDVILAEPSSPTRFRLNVNGEIRTFNNKAVSLIDIRTKDSADRVDLTGVKVRAIVDGGKGPDTLLGGRRSDTLMGAGGSDRIFGNEDGDVLEGGIQDDTLDGGLGDDRVIPFSTPAEDDSLLGGDGTDIVDYSTETKNLTLQIRDDGDEPTEVVTDEIAGDFEIIRGGSGNDKISSFLDFGVTLDGGAGNDTLIGSEFNDTFIPGAGADSLVGNGGDDLFQSLNDDGVADIVDGGAGNDTYTRTTVDALDQITSATQA